MKTSVILTGAILSTVASGSMACPDGELENLSFNIINSKDRTVAQREEENDYLEAHNPI